MPSRSPTEDCVGADIAGLCRLAALAALARDPDATDSPNVTGADFTVACANTTRAGHGDNIRNGANDRAKIEI